MLRSLAPERSAARRARGGLLRVDSAAGAGAIDRSAVSQSAVRVQSRSNRRWKQWRQRNVACGAVPQLSFVGVFVEQTGNEEASPFFAFFSSSSMNRIRFLAVSGSFSTPSPSKYIEAIYDRSLFTLLRSSQQPRNPATPRWCTARRPSSGPSPGPRRYTPSLPHCTSRRRFPVSPILRRASALPSYLPSRPHYDRFRSILAPTLPNRADFHE